MSDTTGETLVAAALAEAVNRAGPGLSSEPRRVQGMISDSLGSDGRTRRNEIEAVVLAAEARIPEDLIAGHLQPEGAVGVLISRGMDADSARFSVDVWRYALGQMGADAEPPTLTKSVESSTDPERSVQYQELTVAPGEPDLSEALVDEAPERPIPEEAGSSGEPNRSDHSGTEESNPGSIARNTETPAKTWAKPMVAGAAALALIVVATIAALMLRGGDREVTAGPDKPAKSEKVSIKFDRETRRSAILTRQWSAERGTLTATLKFDNPTTKVQEGIHYEVIPKAVAKSASEISSKAKFTVIEKDPVISWEVTIPPKKSLTITYEVKVPRTTTDKDLKAWKSAQLAARKAFDNGRRARPGFKMTSPLNLTTSTDSATLTGTVEKGSEVIVAGESVNVAPDGSWTRQLTGLTPGVHPVEIAIKGWYGGVSKTTATITVSQPGAATTTTTTTTGPPQTRGGATVSQTPQPPVAPKTATPGPASPKTPAPTTTAPKPVTPPPPLKPISVSISGPTTWYIPPDPEYHCEYNLTMHAVGFTPKTIRWSGGSHYNDKTTATFVTTGLNTGRASVTVTATAADGRTASASIGLDVLMGTPFSC